VALPGHTPDSTGYWADVDNDRILFGGDVFIGDQGDVKGAIGWLDGLWRSDIRAYARSLDAIEALAPTLVLPGHGLPLDGRERIAASLANCRRRLQYLADIPDVGTMLPVLGDHDPSYE
jgi:glyoxylase-like metal-dependent hydrolase (beta-lactamase superfamily II)